MARMTRAEKYQYCFNQAIAQVDDAEAIGWMTRARYYDRQTPVTVTVGSDGFTA